MDIKLLFLSVKSEAFNIHLSLLILFTVNQSTIKLCPTWSTILWPGRKLRQLTNPFCLFGQLDIDHVGNHFQLMSFLVNKHLTYWDHNYFGKETCLTGQQVYWPSRPKFWITWLYGLIGVFVVDLKWRKNLSFFTCPFWSTVPYIEEVVENLRITELMFVPPVKQRLTPVRVSDMKPSMVK